MQLHHQQGDRDAARDLFARIWDDIGGQRGDPLYVCVLAHAMADVQDASSHLNIGECYRRLGDLDRAREHLRQARAGIDALSHDAYGQLIHDGLDRLTQLLGDG